LAMTSSTSQRRDRTRTSWPTSGTCSGSGSAAGVVIGLAASVVGMSYYPWVSGNNMPFSVFETRLLSITSASSMLSLRVRHLMPTDLCSRDRRSQLPQPTIRLAHCITGPINVCRAGGRGQGLGCVEGQLWWNSGKREVKQTSKTLSSITPAKTCWQCPSSAILVPVTNTL